MIFVSIFIIETMISGCSFSEHYAKEKLTVVLDFFKKKKYASRAYWFLTPEFSFAEYQ